MNIPSLSAPTATATQAGGNFSQSSDYMTFLTMLTVQMRNQDPLNPMQASDFAVQLATFAGVEQQAQTNQLLAALVGRGDLASMGGLVGMEVQVSGVGWFEGRPIDLAPDPIVGADRVVLTVRNSAGEIVATRELDAEEMTYQWDGKNNQGVLVPHGRYSFEIESHRNGELLDTAASGVYSTVREVRRDGANIYLVLPGNMVIESGQIIGVRSPVPPVHLPAPAASSARAPDRAEVTASPHATALARHSRFEDQQR